MYPKGTKDEWSDDNLRVNYNLNKDSIVIDLGGYEAWFTSVINELYKSKIYCFEPIEKFYNICKDKFIMFDNIKVYQSGLSNENKLVGFHVAGDASSLYYGTGLQPLNIPLIKIDEFMLNENIEFVDLLKMNIEGAEYEILEYIIKNNMITKFKNIQIQFHENPFDGWEEIYNFIIDNLQKTHHLTYHFEFKFENWEINN
jgi:FkbM family methyltransferase